MVAFAAAIFALPVFSQDESSDDVEEIIVTGSKLSKTNFDSDVPILTITGEDVTNRMIATAGDAVAQLPNAGLANSVQGDAYQSSSGVGQNIVSLFGLGSQRTLTLVNGRRFVSSNSPQNGAGADGLQVDTNNIPILLLDRVEVNNVGGASVYGADAVAVLLTMSSKMILKASKCNTTTTMLLIFQKTRALKCYLVPTLITAEVTLL